jgi:hypothetical protein
MTTTNHLRTAPDFFFSTSESRKKKSKLNNPEYDFATTHYTAGDERQFKMFASIHDFETHSNQETKETVLPSLSIWDKFTHGNDTMNTFQYLFYKFKKGIYIQFRDSTLHVFLPFSNFAFTNEWSHRIDVSNHISVLKQTYKHSSYSFDELAINCPQKWYANNSIFRYEFPVCENDSGIPILSDMFQNVSSSPNVECFLNKRDHPLIRLDGCEPYSAIFGENEPLQSHSYKAYTPILSMCSHPLYADIPIPTWEDWALANAPTRIYPKCEYLVDLKLASIPSWESRLPIAVFRGGSTGKGVTVDTNPRLKVAYLSAHQNPREPDGFPLLDAGITMWNSRPRIQNGKLVTFSDETVASIPLVPYLSLANQMKFKYIIDIEGHVSAFRLSSELYMTSVILLVSSRYKLWFSNQLVEYVHYVPVKEDLSNLYTQIRWCKAHDSKCKEIAQNARRFYDTFLTREGILAYLESILNEIALQRKPYCNAMTPSLTYQNVSSLVPKQFQFNAQNHYSNSLADELLYTSQGELLFYIRAVIQSLSFLQHTCLFNHNRLEPKYVFFENGRAVFNDFSYSSCIDSNGVFHGSGWMFHSSHDIIVLIMHCISRILEQKVSKDMLNLLFWLSTVFANHMGYGIGRPFQSVSELKRYVHPKRIRSLQPQSSFTLTLQDVIQFLSPKIPFETQSIQSIQSIKSLQSLHSRLSEKQKEYIYFQIKQFSFQLRQFTWNELVSKELLCYFQSECATIDIRWGRVLFQLFNDSSLLEYISIKNTYLDLIKKQQ